jgi:hypothetical protein
VNRTSLTSSSPSTIEFWEDKLETRAARLLSASHKPGFINRWIEQRSPTEISVLRSLVGLPVDTGAKGRVQELLRYADDLRHFVPVVAFGFYKSVLATLEVAERCVPAELRQLAAKSGGKYDTTALLFTIYDQSPEELENVFLLDKLHRVGLAPMKLRRAPRHPARPLSAFLRSDALTGVLERFDREQRDGRRCTLRKVLDREGGHLLFIRRPHRPTHQLVDDRVVHGHTADWIVLEYREEGRLLNVASHGKKASFIIANQITSAFFDAPCEYVNVEEVVYPAQLQRFLEQLAGDEALELTLVAAELCGLPLRGLDTLGGSSDLNASIGPGVLTLQKLLETPLLDGEHFRSCKVLYKNKRVLIKIEKAEDATLAKRRYVVRYGDQRLNLTERKKFQELIDREYGFKIVSTEKRRIKAR